MENKELKDAILSDERMLNGVTQLISDIREFTHCYGMQPSTDLIDMFRTLLQAAEAIERKGKSEIEIPLSYLSSAAHSVQVIQELIANCNTGILRIEEHIKSN